MIGVGSSDLRALGQRALDDCALRVALGFLLTGMLALPLIAGQRDVTRVAAAVIGLGLAGGLLTFALLRSDDDVALGVALAGAAAVLAATTSLSVTLDDTRAFQVVAWVIAGVGGGVAIARGPRWAAAVFLAATVITLGTAAVRQHGVPAIVLLGPLTYAIGGAAISVAARRAFAATQLAQAAADAAEAEHRVALERWRARRASDRQLHDTVLATLTLLAHGAEGVPVERLRAWCERDLAILAADPQLAAEPEPGHPYAARATGALRWLEGVLAEFETAALKVLVHADRPVIDAVRLAPATARALRGALRECLENVRRHAQVPLVEIAASVSGRDLVLVVLDHGRGFDPEAVPSDRMGLRVSVRERLAEVGGRATVWSRPREGASVVIRLPMEEPAAAGPAPVELIPRQEQVS